MIYLCFQLISTLNIDEKKDNYELFDLNDIIIITQFQDVRSIWEINARNIIVHKTAFIKQHVAIIGRNFIKSNDKHIADPKITGKRSKRLSLIHKKTITIYQNTEEVLIGWWGGGELVHGGCKMVKK